MEKWLYKILFIAISLSFFISATEMDLGECHNTFFDEYDTYVRQENVLLSPSTISAKDHDTYLSNSLFLTYNSLNKVQKASVAYEHISNITSNTHKLFLRNCVWRI